MAVRIPVVKVQMVKESSLSCEYKTVISPEQFYPIGRQFLGDLDREYVAVAVLDSKNRILALNTVTIGTLNSSLVHPREVFKPAIVLGAASIIVFHNHPSGDPRESREDIETTKRLHECGKLLGIEVLDHLIIGDDGHYVSMRQRGYM